MQSFLSREPITNNTKTAYLIAAIAVIGCIFGVIATYNYHETPRATSLIYTKEDLKLTSIRDLFEQWKNAFDKQYDNEEQEEKRFEIFVDNYVFIVNHNADPTQTSSVGLNEYADLTTEEFGQLKKCLNLKENAFRTKNYQELDTIDLPASVDWRTKNAVTPIKNQGQCGSCWSFSTTGSLEGLNAIKNGKLLSFSEQQLVDCSGSYGNEGCNGGLMDDAFEYVQAEGIELESTYPYDAEEGDCKYKASSTKFKNKGHTDVPTKNQAQLAAAVAQQPVSVAIEADQNVFQFYSGGVINSKACGTQLDHGVLVVGYGSQGSQQYWIVKNSWGSSWGENGYVRIAKDTTSTGSGICGIALQPSYPTSQDSLKDDSPQLIKRKKQIQCKYIYIYLVQYSINQGVHSALKLKIQN